MRSGVKFVGFATVICIACASFAALVSAQLNPWIFVGAIITLIIAMIACRSWKLAVAFAAALPVAWIVGAVCFWVWFWICAHTPFQPFNSKDSGPFGMFLLVVLPGALAFFLALFRIAKLLKIDADHWL